MDLKLKDKVVIITGGTSGIGKGIAISFAREGAIPVVIGRRENIGVKLVEELKSEFGIEALFIQADLSEIPASKMVIEKTLEKFDRIDVLVNNAGGNDGIGTDSSPEEFLASLNRNLTHYFSLVHYAKPALIKTKGNIINIGSKVANTGQGGTSGYAASKGGIQALTREWAVDLLEYNIRVNEVIPAEAWTEMYENWINSFPNPKEKLQTITQRIPLGNRMTTVEELADTVVFLASEKASHITAQHIYVDGGYTHLDRSIGS
ncbi:SDR family oxidoreductase [Flexithrix dorotheae]|uniref:SDR family oxidoreductase n=1 Tax=Flexithrix dorotheae TaxID=70993 RepID=UPI00036B9A59|nr:SDR family oxidoreductase [Flexithrix dorotheae]